MKPENESKKKSPKQRKEKFQIRAILLLLLLNAVYIGAQGFTLAADKEAEYVLYIGLNDKDAYEQLISTEEAQQAVSEICARYVDGYTLLQAQGGWVDEKNILTQENTLICCFRSAEETDIKAIMDQVLPTLNQNCVLVEKRIIEDAYYYGE